MKKPNKKVTCNLGTAKGYVARMKLYHLFRFFFFSFAFKTQALIRR